MKRAGGLWSAIGLPWPLSLGECHHPFDKSRDGTTRTHTYVRCGDVDVGCSLHVANPPSRSRMQPWCTCEATVSLFARALVAVDRRMFRISYDSHQHHRMLSFACIMHAPPSVSSLASRRDFASRSARILWPSVFLAATFRTYGRVLPKCRFSRSVLGGLL